MPLFNGLRRGVVWGTQFESELSEIEPNPKAADEILEAIERVVSTTPEKGTRVEDSHVWIREANHLSRGLRWFVFYTFTETTVTVLSIRAVKGAEIWPA